MSPSQTFHFRFFPATCSYCSTFVENIVRIGAETRKGMPPKTNKDTPEKRVVSTRSQGKMTSSCSKSYAVDESQDVVDEEKKNSQKRSVGRPKKGNDLYF